MNKSKAIKIAIAFKRGAAFIRGMRQLAQDADVPEGARWITIGAAEGDDGKKHGGRHVLIDKESGTILKGLSKDVQGKTLKDAFKELKKVDGKKGEKNGQADLSDISMELYMATTKFGRHTFADEWLSKVPDGAKTFARLTENMSEDCQYLLKNVLTTVKYYPIDGSESFYSKGDQTVNFPEFYFKKGLSRANRYKTTWETIIHELGHAVDSIAGAKASDSAKSTWVTENTILKNAVESDAKDLISKLKNDVQQKFKDNVREKELTLKLYRGLNQGAGTPTEEQLINFGIAETVRGWQKRTEGGWYGILSGTSDMLSAVTLNEIKDGGSHPTSYWSESPFHITTEFMAHYFEACTDGECKKAFAQVFPTATKVLEILIEKTANTIKQKETKK